MDTAPATSPLEQAFAKVRHLRQVVQIRIVNLGHAAGVFDKMQNARLVSAAVIELIEAQGDLDQQLVAAIGALQAARQEEGASHGA